MRDRLLAAEKVKAIDWRGEALYLLDQRSLPFDESWLAHTSAEAVAQAIRAWWCVVHRRSASQLRMA